MMEEKKISVIVPTYNRKSLLKETLDSLSLQSINKDEFEVIVTDDGSNDGTNELIAEYNHVLDLKYIYQENRGFRVGLARNKGVDISKGSILIFLDSGIILETKALEKYIKRYSTNFEKIAISGNILGFDDFNENENKLNSLHLTGLSSDESVKKLLGHNLLDRRYPIFKKYGFDMENWNAPWILFWSGHISMRRVDFDELGGFDVSFDGWGYEDIDLGIRFFLSGGKIVFDEKIYSVHLPHEKFKSVFTEEELKAYVISKKKRLYEKNNLPEILEWFNKPTIEVIERKYKD
jgi:glycosyltransferase involved in cell wall biosynthesis